MADKKSSKGTNKTPEFDPLDFTPARMFTLIQLARKLMATTLLLSLFQFALVVVIIVLAVTLHEQKTNFLAVYPDGSIVPVHVLSDPFESDVIPQQYAVATVLKTLNLNYDNYHETLESVRNSYSPAAYSQINDQFVAKTEGPLVTNKAFLKASLVTNPILNPKNSGTTGTSPYQWEFKFIVTITLASATASSLPQQYVVTLLVQRVPVSANPAQMQITWIDVAQSVG